MEGIITLIVIIIVFNIFNALMKAVRGSQQASQKRVLHSPELVPPDETGSRWADEDIHARSVEKEKTAYVYESEEPPADEIGDSREAGTWQAPQPVKKEGGGPTSVSLGLQQVLTRKGPFLNAFIFHEILEPPPSLRRKR